jgi:uncharacterized protein (TIGR03067 family)
MAVSTTFKQQCPSCEAMISIKEAMIGKKVECTKCKDKFVAQKPDDDADAKPAGKKDTKTGGKKTTSVSSKTPPPGKRPKLEVDDDDADADEEADEPAQVKNGKAKPGANGKPKKADDDDENADEEDAAASKKKDKKKLTIGLALAGVGVVILIVAAIFVLRGSGGGGGKTSPANPGGGPNAGQNTDKDKKGPSPFDENKPPPPVAAVALTDKERADLSNLLPNDTEHVFRAYFKELFDPSSTLRAAAFDTPGALDDAVLRKRLGFSILGIDDMICTDRFTVPSWKFTVLHFKDLINEDELKAALKLKKVGKGIEGQDFYEMTAANPWFDQLARFSFGVPSNLRTLEPAVDPTVVKPTYFRLYGPQTLIVADRAPLEAFLKVKGKFKWLSTPAASPSNTPPTGGETPAPMPVGTGDPMTQPMPGVNNPMPMPGPKGKPAGGKKGPMPPPPPPSAPGDAAISAPHPEFTAFSAANEETQPQPAGGGGGAKNPDDEFKGTIWEGTEDGGSKIRLVITKDLTAKLDSEKRKLTGANVSLVGINAVATPAEVSFKADGDAGVYTLKLEQPTKMVGECKSPDGMWPVTLQKTGSIDPNPKDPNPKDPSPALPNPQGDTYMTIKPTLKAIMDRMEARGVDGKDKVLLSSATDMDACILPDIRSPEFKNKTPRKARQFWDVTLLLEEPKARIRHLGTALVQRDTLKYRLRNEIICGVEDDARNVTKDLNDRVAKSVARFIQLVVGHEVRLASAATAPAAPPPSPTPPPPGAAPPEEKKTLEPTSSQITVAQQFTTVDFVLDLMLDSPALTQARSIATATASALNGDMMAAAIASLRHQLAAAGKMSGEQGLSQRQISIPPGRLPPGAFPRLETTPPSLRIEREPKNRISFMAGLLPYMGHQNLLDKIKFDQSWRDPTNWVAGSTIVPEFLDPAYPAQTRQVAFGDLPVDFAATHYVGIAGVGLDAASYKRGDPATVHKRGPFSYDESATMEEIAAGRGLSNTILMAQVPHDAITGVSPWIAGGGATLRGVPEKNSIAPFAAKHGEKRGTYVMMADGSVRFITQNVSDDVFKAMSTIAGPAPADFDLNKNPHTPLIPAPVEKSAKEPDKKTPVKADPPKKAPDKEPEPDKKTPVKADPPKKEPDKVDVQKKPEPDKKVDEVKAALQGVWNAKSMVKEGQPASAEDLKSMRFTFKADKLLIRGNFKDDKEEAVSYVIDPAKSPMHLDFTPPGVPSPIRCIIEVTKDELKVCFRPPAPDGKEARPTAFSAQAGSGQGLMIFTRGK